MILRSVLSRYVFTMLVALVLLNLASCNLVSGTPAAVRTIPVQTLATSAPAITTSPSGPAITPTPAPIPTFTAQKLREYALEMLRNNGGCDLPCWWGITPGTTKLEVVKERLGGAFVGDRVRRIDGTWNHSAYFVRAPASLEGYHFTLGFIERDEIIRAIEVKVNISEVVEPRHFAQDWQRFSLDQVLLQYGEPTHVQLSAKPPLEPDAPPSYLMWIVYENHGFWILYAGRPGYDGVGMRICPSLAAVNWVEMWLQSQEFPSPVFQPDPLSSSRSLEEATGMSLEDFYNTFKNAWMCLETAPTSPE